MNQSTLRKILIAAGVLLLILLLFRAVQPKFNLVSSTPKNKAVGVDIKRPIEFTFSGALNSTQPYDSLTITPKVDGKVTIQDKKIIFTPATAFSESTTYSVVIVNAQSSHGKNTSVKDFSFRTSVHQKTAFEESLPYDGGDFIIDRLSDQTIVVSIINPPIDASKQKAFDYLTSQGIDTSTVSVQISSSAR